MEDTPPNNPVTESEQGFSTQENQSLTTSQDSIQSEPEKPKSTKKKTFLIIGGIILGIILLVVIIFIIVSATSKKLECASSQGNITIMYDEKTIKGYLASGMSYDLDTQKTYATQIGIEDYLDEFTDWFEVSTDGTCVRK